MGRSFLSVKLAAVFGLLVAGAVAAQQQMAGPGPEPVQEVHVARECDDHVTSLGRTPRATAPAVPAAGAARI